jgi:hypothetical protein
VDSTTSTPAVSQRGRHALRLAWAVLLRLELPAIAIWIGAGIGLAAITRRVVDWFVMTDELLYERLAISVARLHSPLPHVHGELIPNGSQLYPLLIAPAFRHGFVPDSLHDAHVLNAYVMASAAVPAFLLARSVTGRRAVSYLVALLAVCVPWMVFSSFLLTEVAAYPAFLWAMLALQQATVAPRLRNDALALLGIALATLARTQFFVLALALGLGILLHELAYAPPGRGWDRVRAACRRSVAAHRLLAVVYALLALAAAGLAAAGRLSSTLGTYADAIEGNPFARHFVPSFGEHVAMIALGLGVLPFVVGTAGLVGGLRRATTRERHAFAALGTATVAVLTIEVTSFDLRFGGGVVRDRYLFYVVPVVLVGLAAALTDRRWPRWSLVVPAAVVAYGFSQAGLPQFDKLNVDTPVSVLDTKLFEAAHTLGRAQLLLIVATIVLTALFVEASVFLRRSQVGLVLALATAVALPAETAYAFSRLFDVNGTSGRPITLDQGVVFDWVDRTLGTGASVTMVPFPVVLADYWAGVGYWWDMEFWNKSVDRAAYLPGQYLWTPSTFPPLFLRFEPKTGLANASPTGYVLEGDAETRFRIAGVAVADERTVLLIKTDRPWRAEWLTFGLYDDGWTRPGRAARIRVFAAPGQHEAVLRTLTLGVRAPFEVAARPFRVTSNRANVGGVAKGKDRVLASAQVCVPAGGYAEVRVSTPGDSVIYGDVMSARTWAGPGRHAGVLLTQIALADELGPAC